MIGMRIVGRYTAADTAAASAAGRHSIRRPLKAFASKLVSLVAVILCGGAGAVAAFTLIRELGLSGVVAALVASVIGILVATLLWVAGVALLRGSGLIK